MTDQLSSTLRRAIVEQLRLECAKLPDGACVRLDGITPEDAEVITNELSQALGTFDVFELCPRPVRERQISTDRAVELRNRKARPLLLVVPHGIGDAASSLDNSFDRHTIEALTEAATSVLVEELHETPVSEAVRLIGRAINRRSGSQQVPEPGGWPEWIAVLTKEPTIEAAGRELWRLGLVPDLEPESLLERLADNIRACRSIAFPTRPAAAVIDRLIHAGVREETARSLLDLTLSRHTQPLRFASIWCKHLLDTHPGQLTFECWPFAAMVNSELEDLTATPFRRMNGEVETWSKLRSEDGQLTCHTTEAKPSTIGIRWETAPRNTSSVARWRIELLPPADFRDQLTAPILTIFTKGEKRAQSIKVEITEDDLALGRRFVFAITALDDDGNEMSLTSRKPAVTETDEFDIAIDDEPPTTSSRKSSSRSVAEAVLKAVVEGVNLTPDDEEYETELATGLLRVRLANKRQAIIQLSPLITELQQRTVATPGNPMAYSGRSMMGRQVASESIEFTELALPPALADRRKHVLGLIGRDSRRSIAESVLWDSELQRSVEEYAASYRRALDAATDEQLRSLLLLDTFTLSLRTPAGDATAVTLLPLHPLRLAWAMVYDRILRGWCSQLLLVDKRERPMLVDLGLVDRVSANNLPFTLIDVAGNALVHTEEVSHGTGLYLSVDDRTPELTIDLAFRALGIQRDSAALKSRAAQTASRVKAYRVAHPAVSSLRFIGLNPGQGELLARVVRPLVQLNSDASASAEGGAVEEEPIRTEVVAYLDHAPFNDPLRSLHEIQRDLKVAGGSAETSHLNPPLGLAARPKDRVSLDEEGAHLAVVQDISSASVVMTVDEPERTAVFQDLLTPTHTDRVGEGQMTTWITRPGLRSAGDTTPDITAVHRAHQHAVARIAGFPNLLPVVSVNLAIDDIASLRALHARTDWVITVDRFVGLDLYEDAQGAGLGTAYILDYAPDFVEGLTERLTVTTAHRHEVLQVLERAMTELGLARLGSESLILDTLAMVSGRLALRLLGDESRAREAVSLAALMTYLRSRGELSGQIVIPVDAHPEIFGVQQRGEEEGSRRCDLLLVKITQRSFKIECVEVKARQGAALPTALADRIVDQLRDTADLLQNRFFLDDQVRIDRELQRTRFTALLHYYADRSFLNDLVSQSELTELHRQIDRVEAQKKDAEISLHGYVIALEGRHGFPDVHRQVPIDVLTAEDLGEVGFTTSFEVSARRQSMLMSEYSQTSSVEPIKRPEVSLAPFGEKGIPMEQGVAADRDEMARSQIPSVRRKEPASEAGAAEASVVVAVPESHSQSESGNAPAMSSSALTPATPSDQEKLKDRDPANGVEVVLGKDASGMDVVWGVSTKGSPHAFIVGIPGQGKSVTTRRVINSFSYQGLPSIVFDFHGDMAAAPPEGAVVLDVAETGLPFSPFELRDRGRGKGTVNAAALQVAEIVGYVCDLGEIQTNHVYKGVKGTYETLGWTDDQDGSRLPTVAEFADAVEAVEHGAKGRNARDRLSPLTDFGLFRDDAVESFDPTASGRGLVVDVSGMALEKVQIAATAFILRKIYRNMFQWQPDQGMRLAVVLDEAHRLAKDRTLPKLMKEGRKYGISVVVASQGLGDFKREVVLNAGTKIVFRTNFPDSKTVAGFLRGRDGVDLSQSIEGLNVGEAFVSTPDSVRARKAYMHE